MPTLTPEEIERLKRLEGIFMPHARRQRDEVYEQLPDDLGPRFVHYTSAENLLKILDRKRLWMRNVTCMADYREVTHGFDIIAKYFSDKARLDAFTRSVDTCAIGAATEAINLFNQWLPDIHTNTYISSMSEHISTEDLHGRLSMWRAFGNSSARVAFVFRIPKYSGAAVKLELLFSPVAYLTDEEVHQTIAVVMSNVENNTDFLRTLDRSEIVAYVFTMLLAGVTCLKHEGFKEEREWRAVYSPARRPSPLMESSIEVLAGVPQVIYKIPLDRAVSPDIAELDIGSMFERLIIGPSQYPVAMTEAFTKALTAAGVADAKSKIFPSLIPIRS